jgi:uncharacterized protein (DUF2141 family)
MKTMKWTMLAFAIALANSPFTAQSRAALFKIDFGQLENEREIVDADGNPTGKFPDPLKDWDIIGTWTFADPAANGGKGVANAAGTQVTWKLRDFANSGDDDVTLTMMDNKAAAEKVSSDSPPYMQGQTANNPTKDGLAAVYDGVLVPAIVKDDYLYRNPDTGGTEVLMRFANLNPGFYNVTVFEGRTTDSNGRYGKIWVDDINGKKEPAAQNTGNYSGVNAEGRVIPLGQPRTMTVEIKAGEYLWFAEMEDGSGGISGMIIRSVSAAAPVVDVSASRGLFKIDFGHLENERVPTDADGNPLGDAPAALKDWNVIPTWTFADPGASVVAGSASIAGTANADGTAVTWKLTDFSKDANKNVTLTMFDNKTQAEKVNPDSPPYMSGQTANNPTKDGFEAVYDGVVVPAIVKDDYLYRSPDTPGTEVLMRFAGLNPGTYNVTVFEGRTTDSNGRFGKIWVDDINGKKEPAAQNTGNYSGVNLDVGGVPTPVGQPRTISVEIKAGDYLWFAEMEDSSGGISGMIIRGTSSTGSPPAPSEIPAAGLRLWLRADAGITASASGAVTAWADQSGSNNNAVQATESKAPKLVASALNGKPVLRFDGVDDYLDVAQAASLAITGDIASFFVVKFDDFATFRAVWGKTAGPGGNLPAPTDYYTVPNTGVPRLYRGDGTSTSLGFVDATKGVTVGSYQIVGFAQQGPTLTHYLAGQANGSGQLTAKRGDGGKALKIGSREDFVTKMKGDIAELVIYDRALSDAERTQLVDYLKNKYGLGVPAPSKLGFARSGTGLILSWEGAATLESADEATGPWSAVAGATSPRTVTPSGNRKFYRLKL